MLFRSSCDVRWWPWPRSIPALDGACPLAEVAQPMPHQPVSTPQAPAAIGPYSQAIVAGNLVFTSGQIPLDPATQQMVQGDARAQAERVMDNLAAVLAAAGTSFGEVVKATIFL